MELFGGNIARFGGKFKKRSEKVRKEEINSRRARRERKEEVFLFCHPALDAGTRSVIASAAKQPVITSGNLSQLFGTGIQQQKWIE